MAASAQLDEARLIGRISWRVAPIIIGLYLCAIIDRSNIGFAKLQMIDALHLTEVGFALGSSFFFFSYVAVEIPSTLAVHRFGARLWFARIVFTWGLMTVLLAWSSSGTMFYVLRFLLGAAEGGLYPGIIYFLTLWYPQKYRVQAVGLLTLGSAFGNMLSALIGGPLLDLHGFLGFAGWQWVFIATGVPAVLMTAVVLLYLPDRPEHAKFLSDDEKAQLAASLAQDAPHGESHGNPLTAMWDIRVLALAFLYVLINISLFGVIYWLPTVVKAFGVTGTQNGLLTSIPWAFAAVLLLWLPRRLRTETDVLRAVTIVTMIGLVCFFASTMLPNDWMRFVALAIGTPCISILYPCIWSFPPRFFSGGRAAASIGAISTIGLLGGLFAQNLMPWVAQISGRPVAAMVVPAVCLAIIGLAAILRSSALGKAPAAASLIEPSLNKKGTP
jgi:MFS family permease